MNALSTALTILVISFVLNLCTKGYAGEAVDNNMMLLEVAKYDGYKEIIKLSDLLRDGADVNTKDEDGLSAIHLAAKFNNDPKVIQILVEHGADINQSCNYTGMKAEDKVYGGRPLFFALCYNTNTDVIETVLDMLKAEDRYPVYALVSLAARNPNIEVMGYVYQFMLDDLLMDSALNTNTEIAKGLIEMGANVNAISRDGSNSALYAAVKDNNIRGVDYFLGEGASIAIKCDGNKSILISATSNDVDRNTNKIVNSLIMYGCNINESDKQGRTPLHQAVEKATSQYKMEYKTYPLNVVEELLILGADTTIKNFKGQTAYDYAKDHPTTNDGNPNLSDDVIRLIKQAEQDAKAFLEQVTACG